MRLTHELIKPFEIEADSDQYTLIKVGTVAKGKNEGGVSFSTIGYYTQLEACIKKIAKEQALEGRDSAELGEYIKDITSKVKAINDLKLA